MPPNTASTVDFLPPLKMKDEAYVALEHLIVTGELAPGQWVSEADLVQLTGLGRAPVRSAIERLAEQQLVAVFPRRGAQVCPVDFTQQFRALELRRVVERLLAGSAAARATAEQREHFAALSAEFAAVAASGTQDAMTEIDRRTAQLMQQAADNAFAARAMVSVKGLSRRFWVLYQARFGDTAKMAALYGEVTRAIGEGDHPTAESAVDALLDYVEQFTLKVVGYSK